MHSKLWEISDHAILEWANGVFVSEHLIYAIMFPD
jgi:hypothetical protein